MNRHGTNRGWEAGCRKQCCDQARRNHTKTMRRIQGPVEWVPAPAAAAVLSRLRHGGMTLGYIARRTGLSKTRLSEWANGRVTKVRLADFDKLRNMNKSPMLSRNPQDTVPAAGTRRRIQDLFRRGYSDHHIARETGLSPGLVQSIRTQGQKTVTLDTFNRVRRLMSQALIVAEPQGTWADKTRLEAKVQGYHPFGAWDDIDDPDCEPDEIEAVVDGKPLGLSLADAVLRCRSLAARGFQIKDIAEEAGISKSSLYKIVYGDRPGTKARIIEKIQNACDVFEPLPDPEGAQAKKTKTIAARRGWVVNDGTI